MKICHITSVHPPFDVRIFHKQCRSLVQAGASVVLVAAHDGDQLVDGVHIHAVPKQKNRIARMSITAWQAVMAALGEAPDIYHLHDPELLPWAQLLRLIGKTVVYDMHENVPLEIDSKAWLTPAVRPFVRAAFRMLEPLLLRDLPVVFAELSYAKDYGWVTRHVDVLNLPITEILADIQETKFAVPTVGYLGSVSESRGGPMVLQALHILARAHVDVNWECVGAVHPPAYATEICRLAEQFGLAGVHLHGYLPSELGWRIMARCHIGLALLQPEANYRESYPTKMFEYMALGIPVIVSDFPLYAEVVRSAQCGLCADPQDPNQIAKAIRWLLEHPAEATRMGQRGREATQEKYRWKKEADKLASFYLHLLSDQ